MEERVLIPPAQIAPIRFEVTNTEMNRELIRDYQLVYIDLTCQVQHLELAAGKSITLCLNNPEVRANFSYTMTGMGDCR